MTKLKHRYRANVIYTGKFAEKQRSACVFIDAISDEAAQKYLDKIMDETLKKLNLPKEAYVAKLFKSSTEELNFFMENKNTVGYAGLLN